MLEFLLNDPATPPSDARWSADSSADTPTEPPPPAPGLKSQIGSTRSAAVRLAMAHVDLAKAEASAIGGHLARLAAFAGIAIAVLILAAVLLVVGTALFLGEWLLGS
ncbi:MAG: hypothetical protein H0U58_06290, partial [Chloroflexi bacterium]|nr:hypothetical protein [Chloroflexota bacterium]